MKAMNSTLKTVAAIFILGLLFFSCGFSTAENYGTLVISLPGGASPSMSRNTVPADFQSTFSYRIECTGPGKLSREIRGGASVSMPLPVGDWSVTLNVLNASGRIIGKNELPVPVTIENGKTAAIEIPVTIEADHCDITSFAVILNSKRYSGAIDQDKNTITARLPYGILTGSATVSFSLTYEGVSIYYASINYPSSLVTEKGGAVTFTCPEPIAIGGSVSLDTTALDVTATKTYAVMIEELPPSGSGIWPGLEVWQRYGFPSGIARPKNVTVDSAGISYGSLSILLGNAGAAAFDSLVASIRNIMGDGGTLDKSIPGYYSYFFNNYYTDDQSVNYSISVFFEDFSGYKYFSFNIMSDDATTFIKWPDPAKWAAYGADSFNLNIPTGLSDSDVGEVNEIISPVSGISVTLDNAYSTHYQDLVGQMTTKEGFTLISSEPDQMDYFMRASPRTWVMLGFNSSSQITVWVGNAPDSDY